MGMPMRMSSESTAAFGDLFACSAQMVGYSEIENLARRHHVHGIDVGRFAYRHSSRKATPTPIRTNGQTQEVLTRNLTTPGSRNTKPAIRNTGPVIAQ